LTARDKIAVFDIIYGAIYSTCAVKFIFKVILGHDGLRLIDIGDLYRAAVVR